jgi:adenylosuccinate lyase
MEAHETGKHFKEVLLSKPDVANYLSEEDINSLVDPDKYIGTAVEQVEAVVQKLKRT